MKAVDDFVFEKTFETPFNLRVLKSREQGSITLTGKLKTTYRCIELERMDVNSDIDEALLKDFYARFNKSVTKCFEDYEDFCQCLHKNIRVCTHVDIISEARFEQAYQTVVKWFNEYKPIKSVKFNGAYL